VLFIIDRVFIMLNSMPDSYETDTVVDNGHVFFGDKRMYSIDYGLDVHDDEKDYAHESIDLSERRPSLIYSGKSDLTSNITIVKRNSIIDVGKSQSCT
jgi:endo-alpha-1,4-polygalactosaminidase (GH114 family)